MLAVSGQRLHKPPTHAGLDGAACKCSHEAWTGMKFVRMVVLGSLENNLAHSRANDDINFEKRRRQ